MALLKIAGHRGGRGQTITRRATRSRLLVRGQGKGQRLAPYHACQDLELRVVFVAQTVGATLDHADFVVEPLRSHASGKAATKEDGLCRTDTF
jgi:hypothetical protein